jgi:hypothetical protein
MMMARGATELMRRKSGFDFQRLKAYEKLTSEEIMRDKLTKRSPDRNKIAMDDDNEVKYWTKHLGVTREELQRAIDKVGNSAVSVRKELGKQ